MALSTLVYTAELNTAGDSILFYDITGLYDASSNTAGYGSPNENPGDATASSLVVVNYLGVTVTTINLLSALTALGSSPTAKMLLATIPWSYGDGYHKFTVNITMNTPLPSSSFSTEKIVLSKTLTALNKLWIRAFTNGKCSCNSKASREAMRAEVIYRSIEGNEAEITTSNGAKILELATDVQNIANNRCLIP